METINCNLCGKKFDLWDSQEHFALHKQLGYGTVYDGSILHLRICCHCMEELIAACALSPIVAPAAARVHTGVAQ